MNKLLFKHNIAYWILIVLITLLMLWNALALFVGDYWSILRIAFQSTLLFLVYKRHKWVRSILIVYSLSYAVLNSILFLSKTVLKLIGERDDIDLYVLVEKLIIILLSTIVYFYVKESISVSKEPVENQKENVLQQRL